MNSFSRQQVLELRKLLSRKPITTGYTVIAAFTFRFIFFESTTRLVGRYYRERIQRHDVLKNNESLNIEVVRRSFSYFGIKFSKECLDSILDSSRRVRGKKSGRNLRNGIFHQWSFEDIKEVESEHRRLNSSLDQVATSIEISIRKKRGSN